MFTKARALVVLLAQFVFAVCARADIVGGEEVKERDSIRASTVGLYTPSPDGHGGSLCTASIIDKDIAVTAAHCIAPRGPKPVVLFGRDLHSPHVVVEPVVAAKVNSEWGRHKGQGMDQGDIALVRFKDGLPPGYQKASVARSEAMLKRGAVATLAGYGISDSRTKSGSGLLRKTKVKIRDSRKGKSEMILDQSHGKGACHGDSGGPALVQYRGKSILAGVTNRSYPDSAPDDCSHQVVYTKVSAYRDWIRKSEKELRSSRARPLGAILATKSKINYERKRSKMQSLGPGVKSGSIKASKSRKKVLREGHHHKHVKR